MNSDQPSREQIEPRLTALLLGELPADEAALLRGLAESRPQFAILDVFSTEPLPQGHPFWDHPQVVVTPHAAAGGRGRYERNAALLLANLERYRRGEPLPDELTLGDLPDSSAVPAQFRHD